MNTKPFISTVALPDGIVIGGHWPDVIITWPGGMGRPATKPEYDMIVALENARIVIDELTQLAEKLKAEIAAMKEQALNPDPRYDL